MKLCICKICRKKFKCTGKMTFDCETDNSNCVCLDCRVSRKYKGLGFFNSKDIILRCFKPSKRNINQFVVEEL